MSKALLRRLIPPRTRRRIRSALERFGLEHRFLRLRRKGYRLLRGHGIEVGAFEHPAPVPRNCTVAYVDAITPEQASRLFPEVDVERLVAIDHVVDLDADGLGVLSTGSEDFAIACHVIEHVANPGRFVAELIRVLRPGGRLVIAAPDRDYTFDRARPLTPLSALHRFFCDGRPPIGPEDYRDMLKYVHPEKACGSPEEIASELHRYHQRREHLSVWTAETFREFLLAAFTWCGATMKPEYETMSLTNRFEYFGVWSKQ